jgi:hypothetical protein
MTTTKKTQEARVRRLAARHGYYVRKSRQVHPLENLGEYMLLEASRNIPMLGFRFDASLEEIEEFFREEG